MANPSYYSPKTQQTAQRSQYLAEALKSLQSNPAPYRTATGTNLNILSDAILQVSKGVADKKLSEGAQADKMRLTDAILGTMPATEDAVASRDLNAPKPFDLTPQGIQGRKDEAGMGQTLRGIAEFTGDPMAALQYGQGVKRQQVEDQRYEDQRAYGMQRDQRGDEQWDKSFGLQTDQFGFTKDRAGVQDEQWDKSFGFQEKRAGVEDRQWGSEFAENRRQFDAQLAAEQAAADAERQSEANGAGVFKGPQLATIYNKSMDALDETRAAQGKLDTIADVADQFVQKAENYNSQGEGWWNDVGQILSWKTSDLKQLTNRIAPLMREAGSGAASDNDVKIFSSSTVNIDNTKEGNVAFATGARNVANRNQEYVEFLNQAIDPRDPQSRQKAQTVWDQYKNEVPLFDPETKAPLAPDAVQSFGDWFDSKTQPSAPASQVDDFTDDDERRYQELLARRQGG